jgi:two-component system phosphate regulon sensor histidine kinase PhoR
MKIRLFYKLFVAFAVIGVLTAAIAQFLIERQIRSDLVLRVETEMASEAHIIALMPIDQIAEQTLELAKRSRSRVTLIDPSGKVLADSDHSNIDMDNHLNRSEIQEARLKGEGSSIRYSHSLSMDMVYAAVLLGDEKQPRGYIRLARPLAGVAHSIDRLRQTLIRILILIVLLSLTAALILSSRVISAIRKLAAFTEKVRTGNISGQVLIESHDEIGALAENINRMVEVLQEKIRKADEEKRKLEALFSGMSEGVMVLSADGRIESVNRGMQEMAGQSAANMAGGTILEAFRNAVLHDLLERFREKETTVGGEIELGGDRPLTMDVTISGIQGGDRKTMLVFHDVTQLKMLERIRTDFVANVTHEIRTPLTAIIGFAETLQRGALDDRKTALKFLHTIRENAERLNRLVDDLLTLSSLELGEAKLHPEAVRIEEAVDQSLTVVGEKAREKGVSVRKEIPEELPPILADRDRIAQILLNLLDNAVKFTPSGGSVLVTASPGEKGFLTVRISDTGVGIPKGEIPRLGERFYRADKTRSREMGGTGLGLSIVKHLMMEHRGRIAIDSTVGHGTTVSLRFPVIEEPESPAAKEDRNEDAG